MSKQANKALIGTFVVGAVALVVAGLFVFGSGKFFTKRHTFVMYFEGSVKGLSVGAPAMFRGVKIGFVTGIKLRAFRKSMTVQIPVFVQVIQGKFEEIDSVEGEVEDEDIEAEVRQLIEAGLRAQLTIQSIVTGQLMVEFDFYPDTKIHLVGADKEYPEIPTIPSPLQELTKTVQQLDIEDIANQATAALSGISNFVNSPELASSIQQLNLALKDARKLIHNVNSRVEPLSVSLEETIRDTQQLVRNVDSKIEPLEKGLGSTNKDVQQLVKVMQDRAKRLTAAMEKTSKTANAALTQAEKTLKTIEGLAGAESPVIYKLTHTLDQLSQAARAIHAWADYLQRHPEALIRGKEDTQGK